MKERPDVAKVESIDLDDRCKSLSQYKNIDTILKDRGERGIDFRLLSRKMSKTEQTLVNNLKEFINRWEWFDPIRKVTPRMEPGEQRTLSSGGDNLTRLMNSILSGSPRRFVDLTDEVIKILPTIEEILAPLKAKQATLTVKERGLETATEVGNVSFGLMQILILVVGIITKKGNSETKKIKPQNFCIS